MDMVDYYKSGKKMKVSNVMDGQSSIDTLTTDFLKMKLSDAHEVAMRMYPSGKSDTLLVVIETFQLEVPDSKIRVFDSNWNEKELKSVFKMPKMEDFLDKKLSKEQKNEALSYVEFPLLKLEFTADGGIKATPTLLKTLGIDERKNWSPVCSIRCNIVSKIKIQTCQIADRFQKFDDGEAQEENRSKAEIMAIVGGRRIVACGCHPVSCA